MYTTNVLEFGNLLSYLIRSFPRYLSPPIPELFPDAQIRLESNSLTASSFSGLPSGAFIPQRCNSLTLLPLL